MKKSCKYVLFVSSASGNVNVETDREAAGYGIDSREKSVVLTGMNWLQKEALPSLDRGPSYLISTAPRLGLKEGDIPYPASRSSSSTHLEPTEYSLSCRRCRAMD